MQQENRKFREFFWVNNEIQTLHCSLRKQDDCLTLCPNHQHLPLSPKRDPSNCPSQLPSHLACKAEQMALEHKHIVIQTRKRVH